MKKKSLGRRILRAMIVLVLVMLLAAGTIFALTIKNVSDTLTLSGDSLGSTIGDNSFAYMSAQSQSQLSRIAEDKAGIADGIFSEFEAGVQVVASVCEEIYDNPANYAPREVPLPDPKNDGKLSIQVLYSAHADPADPALAAELGLLGNAQDTIMAVNASQDSMASLYFAAESGFMVQADFISARKFDEAGKLMPLEAKERPWYQGAAATGKPFLTPVTKDAHTPRLAIMCGVPVYHEGRLMGVAGAGMYLDDMEELVRSVNLGESGHACIINGDGQVLFSTYEAGTLAAVADAADLRQAEDAALAALAQRAAAGGSGVGQLSVDGVENYVAYAPLKTVGWSMLVFLSKDSVEAPSKQLVDNAERIVDQAFETAASHNRRAFIMLLGAFAAATAVAILISVGLSRQIVKPIRTLTEAVGAMEGDNLDFDLDLHTGDETETLTGSFRSLTQRMKEYISSIESRPPGQRTHSTVSGGVIESITAERQRISTELSVANRIQISMLPSIFPAFPERSELDVYAVMDPARAVGGDFYDFYLTDEDHLCIVMADVSDKGVPAALFMMSSKILLQSCAMQGLSAAEILTRANEAICSNNEEEMFVTVWVGILELSTGRLTAANAGHEYPILRKPGGDFELFKDPHSFVVGGFSGQTYKEYEVQMEPGSKLFLYTDGVPEAMGGENGGEMFGLDRTLAALNRDPAAIPEQLLRQVRAALNDFVQDTEQFDDLTMLCLEYRGPADRAAKDEKL